MVRGATPLVVPASGTARGAAPMVDEGLARAITERLVGWVEACPDLAGATLPAPSLAHRRGVTSLTRTLARGPRAARRTAARIVAGIGAMGAVPALLERLADEE